MQGFRPGDVVQVKSKDVWMCSRRDEIILAELIPSKNGKLIDSGSHYVMVFLPIKTTYYNISRYDNYNWILDVHRLKAQQHQVGWIIASEAIMTDIKF